MFGEQNIVKLHSGRAHVIANIVLLAFGIILARLWYLQVYKGDLLYQYSLQNRLRREIVRAPRGKIYSRNQKLLVDNFPRFDAILTPQYLRNKKKTLTKLSKILEMSMDKIHRTIKKYSTMARYKPIIIKKNISRKEVARIETENEELPGVSVDTFISREYFDKTVGAHVLGYISEISPRQLPKYSERDNISYRLGDFIGQFGLEEELDSTLRGDNGYEFVEVDAFGRKKRDINDKIFKGITNKPAKPGNNVRLTIDRDMQIAAFKALEEKVGSAVAVDIHTGEILAMVSKPSFDPSTFSRELTSNYWQSLINNENNPLRDRAIQEHYAPGSTFKAITAIAGIEEGLINRNTEHKCRGSFRLGRKRYHCWKRWGHGHVKIHEALRESCNIFFQRVSQRIADIDVISKYAKDLGLGRKTGLSLPREIPGLIPTAKWKKQKFGVDWQLGETLSCAIGQSFVLTTPLQLAMAYSVIANEGTLYKPYLVKEIFDNNGNVIKKFQPEISHKSSIKPSTFKLVKEGLYQVPNNPKGTAWWFRGRGIQMAGKTGTSQVIKATSETIYQKCEEKEFKYRHHGVYVAFAPYQNPKIAVAVVVEHGCHGSTAAAPVARDIMQVYMKKYQPELYEENLKIDKKIYTAWLKERRRKEAERKKKAEAAQKENEGTETETTQGPKKETAQSN
ncbi:MAG: penicillin-binding protein 2 [Bacteriovoracia bacterium]